MSCKRLASTLLTLRQGTRVFVCVCFEGIGGCLVHTVWLQLYALRGAHTSNQIYAGAPQASRRGCRRVQSCARFGAQDVCSGGIPALLIMSGWHCYHPPKCMFAHETSLPK